MNISVTDALGVCIQAVNIGQNRGAYTLEQAAKLVVYVDILSKAQLQLNRGGSLQIDGVVPAYDIIHNAIEIAQFKGSFALADVPKIMGAFATLDGAKETVLRMAGSAGSASAAKATEEPRKSHKGKEKVEQ